VFFPIFGLAIGLITPVVRRYRRTAAKMLLVLGAVILVGFALTNLINQDPRVGLGAIAANRRFGLLIAGGELPVLAMVLLSLKWLDKLYWFGWGIHAALTVWLVVVIIWLEFFWHW